MSWFPEIEKFSLSLGIPLDIFKIMIGFIATLLLSPLYRFFHSKLSRNLLSICGGALLLLFMIEEWAIFVFFGILIPYFFITSFPQSFMISVGWASLLLIIVHSHRFLFTYMEWKVDCSVYIMLLVTKLTYYGKWFEILKDKRERNLLDYLGYNFFFPSILSGPTFSFEVFLAYMNQPQKTTLRSLSGPKAIKPLAFGLLTAFIAVYFMPLFKTNWVVENQYYLQSSLLIKTVILIPLGLFYRSKYYAAWYIGQTAVNLSGLSETPEGNYQRVKSVSIQFQIEPNPKLKTQYWNSEIQLWLKYVVYDSISSKVNQTLSLFFTFFVSACWHGFYLTYYLCFAEWAILNHITKWCYKWSFVLPKTVTGSKMFYVLTWLTSCITMNSIGMVAVILEWNAALKFYEDLHYFPIIVLTTVLLLSWIFKPPAKKTQKKE